MVALERIALMARRMSSCDTASSSSGEMSYCKDVICLMSSMERDVGGLELVIGTGEVVESLPAPRESDRLQEDLMVD